MKKRTMVTDYSREIQAKRLVVVLHDFSQMAVRLSRAI